MYDNIKKLVSMPMLLIKLNIFSFRIKICPLNVVHVDDFV